jgi:hypothetical protein
MRMIELDVNAAEAARLRLSGACGLKRSWARKPRRRTSSSRRAKAGEGGRMVGEQKKGRDGLMAIRTWTHVLFDMIKTAHGPCMNGPASCSHLDK